MQQMALATVTTARAEGMLAFKDFVAPVDAGAVATANQWVAAQENDLVVRIISCETLADGRVRVWFLKKDERPLATKV